MNLNRLWGLLGIVLFAALASAALLEPARVPRGAPAPAADTAAESAARGTAAHGMGRDGLRIVSLAPSFTEILLYLGLGHGDELVGVTVFCEGVPPSVARVGDFLHVDAERIAVELVPDLVLGIRGAAQEPVFRALEERGIRVEVLAAESIDDLRTTVRALAGIVGAVDRGERYLARLDRVLAPRVEPGPGVPVAAGEAGAGPRVLFVVDHEPLHVAGGGSFVHAMLVAAGARNVFGDRPGPRPRVETEAVVARAPDVVIDVTLDPTRGGSLSRWAPLAPYMPAVAEGRVHPFPQVRCGIQICEWVERLRVLLGEVANRR